MAYTKAKDETQRIGEVINQFVATSERTSNALSLASSWSHTYANNIGYIRPKLELGYTRLIANKTQEKDAGALSLHLTDYSEGHGWVEPEVELGWDAAKIGGGNLRFKYSLGSQYYLSGKSSSAQATFDDAPLDAQPMLVPIELARPNMHSKLGLEYATESGAVLLLEVKQSRSDYTNSSGAELQLRVPF